MSTPLEGAERDLEWSQGAVGGYVQYLRGLPLGGYVIVNEDGVLLALPVDELAMERLGDVPGRGGGTDVVLVEYVQ
jgi:hypothetical protein